MTKSKKNKLNPKEIIEDADKIFEIIDKLDNLNLEDLDIKSLEEEMKTLDKNFKNKYKDYYTEENMEKYLDSEE
jgi:Tfp pilus assembly ATPase PilU